MAEGSSITRFAEHLNREVNFISNSGKKSKGFLTHISKKNGLYEATIQVPGMIFTSNKTVPINNVLIDVVVPRKVTVTPQATHISVNGSSIDIPNLGLYKRCSHHNFEVGQTVMWSPDGDNPGGAFLGTITFIGQSEHISYAKFSVMAVVQFEQDQITNGFPYFLGSNRNAVPIESLQHLPKEPVNSGQPKPTPAAQNHSATNNAPQALVLSKAHPSEDFENVPSLPQSPKPTNMANLINIATTSTPNAKPTKAIPGTSSTSPALPPAAPRPGDRKPLKGIHGSNNSCYLDSSLFALFAFNMGLDSFLEPDEADNDVTIKAKKVLRDQILEPLRKSQYVPSENINELRKILADNISPNYLLSFMDSEELILSLFDLISMPELFQYDSDASDNIHQILLPQNWARKPYVTVQHLLEQSFAESSVKLTYVPNVFIVKLPVSNGVLVSSDGVIPTLTLDLKLLLSEEISSVLGEDIPKLYLSAVICLRSSHFVTFARDGVQEGSPWFFMDSNPTGLRPELMEVQGLQRSIRNAEEDLSQSTTGEISARHQTGSGSRLFRDAYICIYVTKYT